VIKACNVVLPVFYNTFANINKLLHLNVEKYSNAILILSSAKISIDDNLLSVLLFMSQRSYFLSVRYCAIEVKREDIN